MMKAVGGYRQLQGERLAWAILSLFVLALVLRAGFLLLVWGVDAPMDGDEPAYHGYAESFVEGNGWQNGDSKSGRSPLLPLQLAAIYSVTGPDPGLARWYMVVVSALGSPLVYLLARQIYPKLPLVAILAGVGWAVYPPAIWYGSNILTETMGAVLVAASVASYFWSARSGNLWAAGLT